MTNLHYTQTWRCILNNSYEKMKHSAALIASVNDDVLAFLDPDQEWAEYA